MELFLLLQYYFQNKATGNLQYDFIKISCVPIPCFSSLNSSNSRCELKLHQPPDREANKVIQPVQWWPDLGLLTLVKTNGRSEDCEVLGEGARCV